MAFTFYTGFVCLCLALISGYSHGLQVEEELEVLVVENGTVEEVILDCPYTLGEDDLGLAIKWYHMENPVAVYQWIAGYPPAAIGILADRVDLEYVSGTEDNHRHRALRIPYPTTELTGDYSCKVSTFEEEKTVQRKLVVYSKPANVHVWAKNEGETDVKVICEVEDVYPEPEVNLYMAEEGSKQRVSLEGAQKTTSWEKGLYDSKVELIMDEEDLEGPTHFECEVMIPNTEIQVVNKTHYEPRQREHTGAVTSGSDARFSGAVLVSLACLVLWRV